MPGLPTRVMGSPREVKGLGGLLILKDQAVAMDEPARVVVAGGAGRAVLTDRAENDARAEADLCHEG